MLFSEKLFIAPPEELYRSGEGFYRAGHATYTSYNYLGAGLVPRLKRQRFEVALELARPLFGTSGAIDFGCADGVLLPSLARYFPHVAAVDADPDHILIAERLTRLIPLPNVDPICNRELDFPGLRDRLGSRAFGVMFLLETLEHVGDASAPYASRLDFVDELFSLLSRDAIVIASVPKMVGLSLLAKYAAQSVLGMRRDPLSFRDLLRAGVLKDTTALEPRWKGGHIGFNNEVLRRHLRLRFDLQSVRHGVVSEFYVLKRR